MCEDLHQTRLQMFAKIQLEVSHSCQEMIQTLRRMLCSIYMACRQDAQDTMRENTGPSRDLQLMRKAKAAKKPGSQCTYPAAEGSEAMMSHVDDLVLAVVHPLMLSSISSSTPTLCITAPDSFYSLCTTVQRSTEVSLDLDPSTPRIQLRRRMQRSRTANDQGQQGDQWIKCSVYGWRVCMDKIRR